MSSEKGIHYESGGIVIDVGSRLNAIEQQQLTISRKMANFTFALVLCTVGTGGVAIWQARIASKSANAAQSAARTAADTLTEIEKGSTDTHELAVQAKNQADGTRDIANRALIQSTATNRLAHSAETSIQNALEADRPWIGALLNVEDFAVNKTPVFTVIFVNSGRRPARMYLGATGAKFYVKFPSDPEYFFNDVPSHALILPNQNQAGKWSFTQPLSEEDFRMLKEGHVTFFVYATVEYADVRTNTPYVTHSCWRYATKGISVNSNFVNCNEYNDAK